MQSLRTMRVLLVEDNDEHARIVSRHLGRVSAAEVTVCRAATLAEGLDQLAGSGFDAVLLDLKLPDSDFGDTVARVLAQTPQMPIVVLSTLEERDFAHRALQEGAQDYLYKTDLSAELLFRAIDYAIERQKAAKWAREEARRKQALFELAQRTLATRTPSALLQEAAVLLRGAMEVEVLGIWEDTPGEGSFQLVACDGLEQDRIGGTVPTSEGLHRPHPEELRSRYGLEQGLEAVIRGATDGEPWGLVTAHTREPREFSADEAHFLETAANVLAAALLRLRAEQSLLIAKDAAEAANRAKGDFLNVMSHELRTPLNSVLGYSDLLLLEVKDPITDNQRQLVQRIRASGKHQLVLIEEILSYAQIEAGKEQLKLASIDPALLVREVSELIRPEAERKGLELIIESLPTGDRRLVTDPVKLRRVLINLTGNAVKFTRQGAVRLSAAWDSEGRLAIHVHDTGPGIPDEARTLIWEPFTQVNPSATREAEGTGLGLAIVRRLVEFMGGEVELRTVVGEGSTFSVRLPQRATPRLGMRLDVQPGWMRSGPIAPGRA